jgi:hypothetical protein
MIANGRLLDKRPPCASGGVPSRNSSAGWKPVHVCPICNHRGWCSVLDKDNGRIVCCRREESGCVKVKEDSNGIPYYVHVQGDVTLSPSRQEPGPPRAGPRFLHWIYTCMLRRWGLSGAHRKAMRRRGLSDGEIDRRGYATIPCENYRVPLAEHETPEHFQQVERSHEQVARRPWKDRGDLFARVPGFRWYMGRLFVVCPPGMAIPVREGHGLVVALKIRLDGPRPDGTRYVYLSSASYGGPGPGSPPHHPLPRRHGRERQGGVRLTEGELKADVATELTDTYTLSFPGVGSWRGALEAARAFAPDGIVLAFDGDARSNPMVARAQHACARAIRETGMKVKIERWNWE